MNNESTIMNQNERVRENLIYKKEKKDLKKIIYDIYENDGLIKKIRSKENISQELLKIIIDEIFEFNKHIEKDENVLKMNIEYLINRELGIDNLDIITNELNSFFYYNLYFLMHFYNLVFLFLFLLHFFLLLLLF